MNQVYTCLLVSNQESNTAGKEVKRYRGGEVDRVAREVHNEMTLSTDQWK